MEEVIIAKYMSCYNEFDEEIIYINSYGDKVSIKLVFDEESLRFYDIDGLHGFLDYKDEKSITTFLMDITRILTRMNL